MKNDEPIGSKNQAEGTKNLLEDIIREGARKLLQAAIEHEVTAYIDCSRISGMKKGGAWLSVTDLSRSGPF